MSLTRILSIALVCVLAAGCGKNNKKDKDDEKADKADKGKADNGDKGTTTAEKEADTDDDSVKGSDDAVGMTNKMMYCPSAVEGARTEITEVEGALVLDITGEGDAAADIRRRAAHLEAVDKADTSKVQHSGQGTGGGGTGQCPVVMESTTLKVESTDAGIKITITPDDAAKLADLKAEAQKRLDNLPGGGGKGGHKGGGGARTGKGGGKGTGSGAGKAGAEN